MIKNNQKMYCKIIISKFVNSALILHFLQIKELRWEKDGAGQKKGAKNEAVKKLIKSEFASVYKFR